MADSGELKKRMGKVNQDAGSLSAQASSSSAQASSSTSTPQFATHLQANLASHELTLELEQKQINLVLAGDQEKPILIGASIKELPIKPQQRAYKDAREYQRANTKWGREQAKIQRGAIELYTLEDTDKANVLHPERYLSTQDGAVVAWTISLNEAFIVGAIESNRKIKLVTDWQLYPEMDSGCLNNGTFWELLALSRCGYTFYTGEDQKILAVCDNRNPGYKGIVKRTFDEYQSIITLRDTHGFDAIGKVYTAQYQTDAQQLFSALQSAKPFKNRVVLN